MSFLKSIIWLFILYFSSNLSYSSFSLGFSLKRFFLNSSHSIIYLLISFYFNLSGPLPESCPTKFKIRRSLCPTDCSGRSGVCPTNYLPGRLFCPTIIKPDTCRSRTEYISTYGMCCSWTGYHILYSVGPQLIPHTAIAHRGHFLPLNFNFKRLRYNFINIIIKCLQSHYRKSSGISRYDSKLIHSVFHIYICQGNIDCGCADIRVAQDPS